ncbi:Iron sulfur cluster assembly protein 1 mitochondrial [Ceratocystis platani]|uniref:Iron-sulfur cluster assembly protein n=1 Tax=Ceratocystis fimbriata f. sp. platani TaxID=88771 RepID=A0A0F8D389_CERFI|nr:Iron sulfur cluster assembly protein 1 mitochondrial [Ceratocystis platani]
MFAIRNTLRAVRPALARKTFTPRVAAPIARRSYHEKDDAEAEAEAEKFGEKINSDFERQNANFYALIDHYTNPRNVGSLNGKDPNVGSGLVGAPACGDVMKLDIQVDEKTGTIIDARFKTFGCGSAIASSSYVTTLVKGKRLEEAAKIRNVDIASELCLPPVKLHCSMLAEDAIQAAIANYKSKRTAFTPSNLSGTAKTLESA